MRRSFQAAAALAMALAATGCRPDHPSFKYLTIGEPAIEVPGYDIAIAQGTSTAIVPYMFHQEIEGTSVLAIDDARSDDTTVLRVARSATLFKVPDTLPARHRPAYVLSGVAPGSTTVRLFRDDDEVGILTVTVRVQGP